jgi:hypothetical protein
MNGGFGTRWNELPLHETIAIRDGFKQTACRPKTGKANEGVNGKAGRASRGSNASV